SGKPGSSTEFNHPDYGSDLDSVLGSDKNQEKDTDHELGNTPNDEPDISDTPDTSVEESDDEKEETGDEPKESSNNNEKDKENADKEEKENTDKEEKENTDKEDDDGGSLKDLWNSVSDPAGLIFGVVNSVEGTGTAEGNLKLIRKIIDIPITIFEPNMSDGGKAASDLGLFGIEATEDGIKWSKRLKDASAMTDLRDKHTTLFSILDKGKETLSRIKHSTVTMTSIGKDAVKSNSSFIYLSAKGKDFLGKTQNLF